MGRPKVHNYDSLFNKILSDLKSGLTIRKSCEKHGVQSGSIYNFFTDDQKKQLKECKVLLSKSFKQQLGDSLHDFDCMVRDNDIF